jgi:hypothetical protein
MAAEAMTATVRRFGIDGCVSRMAQEFGDHPDAAAERMSWIRQLAAGMPAWPRLPAAAGRPSGRAGNETEATSGYHGAASVGSVQRAHAAPPGVARSAAPAARWLGLE